MKTSAAFLGLAIASGLLFPEGGSAATEPTTLDPTRATPPISGDVAGSETENSLSESSDWQPSILRNLTESNAGPMSRADETPPSVATEGGETEIEVDEPANPGTVIVPEPSVSKSEDKSFSFDSHSAASDRTEEAEVGASPVQTVPDSEPRVPGPLVIDSDLNPSVSVVYQVGSGDTLDRIARTHGVAVTEILKANNLTDPNFIKVNQELKIPKRLSNYLDRQKEGARADTQKWEGLQLDGEKTVSRLPSSGDSESDLGGFSVRSRLSQTVIPSVIPSEIQGNLNKPVGLKLNLAGGSFDTGSDRLAQLGKDFTPISPDSAKDPQAGESKDLSSRESDAAPRKLASLDNRPTTKLYTDRLRSEIERLRAEYRAEQFDRTYSYQAVSLSQDPEGAIEEPAQIVAAPSPELPPHRINPEFNPNAYDPRKDAENGQASAPEPREVARRPEGDEDRDAVLATAPLGADAYDPLQNPALGRIVSPHLPPLPGPDTYLPGGSMRFNGYIWPSEGILTSGYGWRWGRMHRGIDIAGPIGTPIVAAAPGVVTYAGWNSGGYGNLVELEHPDGSLTLYAHNHRILVNKGQKVTQGQQIAEMGSTGRSTGPHLHFEIHPSGQGAVNPMALLPRE
ncbi:LysM peptidoglycan-binding domain-containing M23 family metallopeptidase [Lyngbya sp. CCY1209]|nr:LysM peptidoglycan-binding domain-containing M23 family metallopeptidase [Lyngbya sp. CCY1209]MEB3885281.1 LysM peptidoglycan-binding domain-containing M23 family metallopeptidase [Lyngbya sp. CCY1209]